MASELGSYKSRIDKGLIRELTMKIEERARSIASEKSDTNTGVVVKLKGKGKLWRMKKDDFLESGKQWKRTFEENNPNEPPVFS